MFFRVSAYSSSDSKRKKNYVMVAKNFDEAIKTAEKIHGKNLIEIALLLSKKGINYE